MDKYEYQTFIYTTKGFMGGSVDIDKLQSHLNDFGNEGWELVSSTPIAYHQGQTISVVCILKRKKA